MRRSFKRMIGGAASICPPGFFCMDTGFLLLVTVVLVSALAAAYLYSQKQGQQQVKIIVERESPVHATPMANPLMPARDQRFPGPPERSYATGPDTRGFIPPPGVPVMPIQVPTQGLPQEFQQTGVLTAAGGSSTSASPNRTLLPLFGRKVASSRERYNYYTRTDGFNPIQVSVSYKNRSCDDDNGCDEIMSGDTVAVPQLGQTFTATVYRYNTPRYIPLV
jgi:hypothetical protein